MKSETRSPHGDCVAQLQTLGAQIRAQRKALRVSATVTAEAAGMSRVTLHRIEKGEPTVTMGSWCSAMAALGLTHHCHIVETGNESYRFLHSSIAAKSKIKDQGSGADQKGK